MWHALQAEDDISVFVKLLDVFVDNHKVYFRVKALETLE